MLWLVPSPAARPSRPRPESRLDEVSRLVADVAEPPGTPDIATDLPEGLLHALAIWRPVRARPEAQACRALP